MAILSADLMIFLLCPHRPSEMLRRSVDHMSGAKADNMASHMKLRLPINFMFILIFIIIREFKKRY